MSIGIEILGVPGVVNLEGQARYAYHLARALLGLDCPHRFLLMCNSARRAIARRDVEDAMGTDAFEWVLTRTPMTGRVALARALKYRRFARAARRHGVQLFHGTSFRGLGRYGVPSVVTVHDLCGMFFPTVPARDRQVDPMIAEVRASRRVIVPSENTRRDMVMFWGVEADKIDVVPEGYNRPPADLGEASIKLPERFVLYVGSYRQNKNIDGLLRAFARVAPQRPDVQLVMVGGEPGAVDRVARRADQLGLAGRVVQPGYVPEVDLDACYRRALCLVQPSFYEGFGLTPLEALGRGTAVAVSGNTSMPGVVGEAGLTFDPLDIDAMAAAAGRLVDDESLRKRLGEAGRARAAELTWRRAAELTLRVYRQCLQEKT
ncbi:MAG: glycosyltransferase family 4 protein [Planctomycetota bacterium]